MDNRSKMRPITVLEDNYASVSGESLSLLRLAGGGCEFTTFSKSLFSGQEGCRKRLMKVVLNAIDLYDVGDYVDLAPYAEKVMFQIGRMMPADDEPYLVRVTCDHEHSAKAKDSKFSFQFEFMEPNKLGVRSPTGEVSRIAFATL